ncbi:MAG: GspL/Epsl periplasmic domain-containing protein [Mariprofundus sp.]|nr:GspL/Epsl periplasmic domain-containing protein [Mariprofundus sp.]
MMTLSVAENESLPTLPDNAIVHQLFLPAEQLLSRTFQLPFAQPKFIDQDILGQELEEHTAELSEAWWLSWQAGKQNDGVAGIMFGMPESMRQHIENDANWQQAQYIGSDMYLRLHAQLGHCLEHAAAHPPENEQSSSAVAVFDADHSGLFFGLWQPAAEHRSSGLWLAMRRLNWREEDQLNSALVEDIKRSLLSMGWHDEQDIATGSLPPQLHAALDFSTWQGHLCEPDELPSRADATMAAASISIGALSSTSTSMGTCKAMNFRHGRWRSGSHLNQFTAWYRSIAGIAILALLWSINMMWQNQQLQNQLSEQQQAITAAFHTGLPNEPVIIDALAQLRKAAGGNRLAGAANQRSAAQWLQHVEQINQVYQQMPWTIKALSFQQGIMSMSGQSTDLQSMNRILKALQQRSGLEIQIQDTDLRQNQVRFKMVWP